MKEEMDQELKNSLPDQAVWALNRLESAGYEAYLAGGCVRDFLLGKKPHDFDITTNARPEQVMAVFAGEKLIPTGLQHGTVTVLKKNMPLEITTYRCDGDYSDGRRPDWVDFTTSLSADLARRDFTINAFAYSPVRGLVDLYGGRADLKAGVIRCVGKADERFGEDGLRILRALRFASQLDFSIEAETAVGVQRNKALLQSISRERIAVEITRLLTGPGVARVLTDFTDVIGVAIPQVLPLIGFDQNNAYHRWDLLHHTAYTVEASEADETIRWAAFLHDIGKPDCYVEDEEGRGHFYGHESRGAQIAEEILRSLKFPVAFIERVRLLVQYHDGAIPPKSRAVKRWLNRTGPEAFFQLLKLKAADRTAHGGKDSETLPQQLQELEEAKRLAERIIAEGQCFTMQDLAVTGKDLIAIGVPPGKEMGDILKRLLRAVIEEQCENEKEALLQRALLKE